ncbi:MAG: zincin-like metallopeptidase domain-containing protein [Candidatus Sphingomonas colombiensis]|nr:zincin-like metallopeptidase domain-containing protein [Sphingomonas sp.]WEK43266.1 MAG: zincin-like metallopeptidase domain-containing protein [Sphingomonas sp.]
MRQKSNRRARDKAGAEQTTAPATEPRTSLYDEVTRRIVTELEAGRFPWVQPWGKNGGSGPGLPRNALTARPYSGVNVLILWGAVIEQGWPSQSWLTFRQALAAGGCVRKGEHGTTIVYADLFTPEAEKARARETGGDARAIPFLKRFTVFNVAQCEGLRDGLAADPTPLPEREIVPVAESVIAASGVDFRIGGDKAFYMPSRDVVQVPPQPAFFDQINYYRTALHEICHASGHSSRLNRNLANAFGSKDYAREELIAEMGSAFLCAALGIVPTVRHADYLASWLDVLPEDNRAIFRAASAASKAADWLLARHAAAQAGMAQDDSSERRAVA